MYDQFPLTIPFGSNLPFAFSTANFTNTPNEPVASQPADFDASTSTCVNGSIIRYAWDFGDGKSDTGQTVSHVYGATGNYNVTLTAVSSTFIPHKTSQIVYVRQTPIADFSFSSPPAVGYPCVFDASISNPRGGTITGYLWDFGDGDTASTSEPTISHVYALQKDFSVTLTVLDTDSLNGSSSDSVLVMMSTFVSIHTSPTSSVVLYAVDVDGVLNDFYGVPLNNKTVILSYTFQGATGWFQITSDNTNSNGEYDVAWIPTATGDFTLKAECDGNTTHLGASSTVSLSTLFHINEGVFSVESNSTVADLTFTPAGSRLTFSVSGEESSVGYVKVTFSKGYAKSSEDIRVYLDGSPATFSVASTGDSWIVTSIYTHSTHLFEVDLAPWASEGMPDWGFWTIVIAVASVTVVVAIVLVVLGVRRSKRKKLDK